MKLQQRFASFLLCLVIMITGLVGYIPSYAFETLSNENLSMANSQMKSETLADSTIVDSNIASNETAAVGSEKILLPDIVKGDNDASRFIGRAKAKENSLNTFVFKNQDGTQTMKVYSHPVKYIDEKGNIQDISTGIKVNNDGTFETKANSIKTVFSKELKDGIMLQANNVNIRLVSNKATDGKLSEDNKIVSYVYDDKTTIEYSLTYTGFKEDIVVNEYTGQTEYEFTLYTNGLTLVKENGSYFLKDSNGKVQATIGDIIIFTADERNNTLGEMTHETITPNHEYVMTIHVDKEYLIDEKTKYPIRIDPTIEINYDNNGSGAIEDITINENTTYSGTSGSLYVGRSTDGSLNRVLMRFPNLSLDGISASQIISANVEIRDLMCQSDEDMIISCYAYSKPSLDWSESMVLPWLGLGDDYYFNYAFDSLEVSYGQGNATGSGSAQRYRFDITSIAAAWANGVFSPSKGLVFKATDSFEEQTGDDVQYWKKTFASYNRASNKPSLSITFEAPVSINLSEASVVKGNTIQLNAFTSVPATISWISSDNNVATVDNTGKVTALKTGKVIITVTATYNDQSVAIDYCTVYVRISDGVYNIENITGGYYLSAYPVRNDVRIEGLASASSIYSLRQSWKVTYMGSGYYCIQPMIKLNTALTNGNNQMLKFYSVGDSDDISTSNSDFSLCKWIISEDNNGYTIADDAEASYIWQLNSNTYYAANVTVNNTSITDQDTSNWDFQLVSNVSSGLLLFDHSAGGVLTNPKKYITVDQSKKITDINLNVAVYSPNTNSQSVNWRVKSDSDSSNDNCVTINSQTGEITGILPGIVTIQAYKVIRGVEKVAEYTLEILAVKEGFYFIENGYYDEMIQINDDYAPGYDVNNCIMELLPLDGGKQQRWEFTSLSNGYYSIVSAISNMALTVPTYSNESDNEGINIIQTSYTGALNQQWRVELKSNGKYIIKARSAEQFASNYVLSSQSSIIVNPNVQQRTYTDDSNYRDEWHLHPAKVDLINVIDSSMLESYIEGNNMKRYDLLIETVINKTSEMYQSVFGINLYMDGDAMYNPDNPITMCGNNSNGRCYCNEAHSHRELYTINEWLNNEYNEAGHFCISWSNKPENSFCFHSNGFCYEYCDSNAIVIGNSPIIQILDIDKSLVGGIREIMVRILSHELAHSFGMDDVYEDHELDMGQFCTMDYIRAYIPTYFNSAYDFDGAFCESCNSTLNTHISNYFLDLYS